VGAGCLTASVGHRGVAESDPRNRGPIAFFKPKKVTTDSARESLRRARPDASLNDIEAAT